ncbi:hypothetical protein CXF88_05110 [Shewanella sp. ALD9]|nr:hypothetical protein CXF88_05110 [Shewanella sp. ALD9]
MAAGHILNQRLSKKRVSLSLQMYKFNLELGSVEENAYSIMLSKSYLKCIYGIDQVQQVIYAL